MNSLLSVLVAAAIGVGLAVATTVSVVNVTQQTPANTQPVDDKPLIVYGDR